MIRDKLREGLVIPFLGSGASLSERKPGAPRRRGERTRLPTAAVLARYLARRTRFPQNEPRDLTKVAQYYNVVGGRRPLHQDLHGIFNWNYPFMSLHTYLAGVEEPLLIVTTNYDDLIERAFSAKRRPYDLVIHTTDPTIGDRLLWWEPDADEPRKAIPNKVDILDQFEEYFLYHPQDDAFAAEFPAAVTQSDLPVSFLISLREDSLAKLDRFEGRIPNLLDNYLRIEHLDHKAAQAAIEEPIEQYNRLCAAESQPISIEQELVVEVLKQVKTGEVILGETGHGVTPDRTKIALSVHALKQFTGLSEQQLNPVLNKLSSAAIGFLRPVAARRYEIFHDVVAPAILDWRARYVQAQERADAERKLAEATRRAEEQAPKERQKYLHEQ